MQFNRFSALLVVVGMTLAGCGGGGGSTSTDPVVQPTEIDANVTITNDYSYQVESLGTANTINASVSLGTTTRDLYLVLSNSATTSDTPTIVYNAKITAVPQAKSVLSTDVAEKPRILHHPQYVEDFNSHVSTLFSNTDVSQAQAKSIAVPEKIADVAGANPSTGTFYLSSDTSLPTLATARSVVSDGVITLNIWVSDDSYDASGLGTECQKVKCVTQDMVDALADMFLQSGSDNDIYDWVTNIYGEEWGGDAELKYSNLISDNNQITILLTDIPNSEAPIYNTPDGGVIVFFWAKDNFKTSSYSGSNERVMFYIDSVMFANGNTPWSIDDYWPKETVSTLAHEFQHMIHFYQKTILRANENTDTWINEMLSESTEDIVATKIRHIGPRGVDYMDGSAGDPGNTLGRYPLFNANNTLSLTAWNSVLADYSKVNAFGAYLIRNYGGAQLLHNIMYNSYTDARAVVSAVGSGKTFSNLLSEWGVAVMLSDHVDLLNTPFYNTGDFTYDLHNGITYELGSINFFNYILLNPLQDGPKIYTTAGTIQPQGNYYYKIGDNVTGDFNMTLELNGQTEATLIAK